MAIDIEAALVRAIAPSELADAIIGDLYERRVALARILGDAKASDVCRADVLRSLPTLVTYSASRTFSDNWTFALAAAAVTCAFCVATIPLWSHIGMGGGGYHLVRLAIIGLILGSIPRASSLSCLFLIVLIGIADRAMDAHNIYRLLLEDGVAMASMLVALLLVSFVRTSFFRRRSI
jgi:hypothetical protein